MSAQPDNDPTIALGWEQYRHADLVGFARYFGAYLKRRDAHDAHDRSPYDGIADHGLGAVGEYAYCSLAGLFWPAKIDAPDYGAPDLVEHGVGIEVRTTRGTRLKALDGDRCDAYVCVVALAAPVFRFAGYCTREFAHRAEFRANPGGRRPCYMVPEGRLTPLPVGGLIMPTDVFMRPDLTVLKGTS